MFITGLATFEKFLKVLRANTVALIQGLKAWRALRSKGL
jgi:hypothetical protein